MTNRGVAPPNPTTDVGKFRFAAGDTEYKPLDPPESGYGDYNVWSDAEIEAYLELGGSVARAIAIAYRQMAAHWTSTAATIKTDDLTYSAKDTVGNWLALADYWDKLADSEEAAAVDDVFELVAIRPTPDRPARHAEGSPWPNRWCW